MILIFLGFLIVLLFMLLFFNKEGMEVPCKYQYLSPNQQNTPLDDATINEFILKFNGIVNQFIPGGGKLTKSIYDEWINAKIISSDEVQFYIKNSSFPSNEYLVGELTNNKNIIFPTPYVANTISNGFSARGIYQSLIMPAYATNASNPDFIESMQIYTGTKPEPSCASPAADPVVPSAPVAAVAPVADDANTVDNKIYACNSACNNACYADSSFQY